MNLDNLKENLIQINDLIKSSLKEIEHYKKENDILLKILQEKEKEIEELKDKFSIELNLKDEEINKHSTELNNFSKVSMVVSLNKELEEKNKQIKLLETQLQTFKKDEKPKKQSNTKKEIEKEEIIENSDNQDPDDSDFQPTLF